MESLNLGSESGVLSTHTDEVSAAVDSFLVPPASPAFLYSCQSNSSNAASKYLLLSGRQKPKSLAEHPIVDGPEGYPCKTM
jgi:hypothetical protein